jgi:hypothetical protein
MDKALADFKTPAGRKACRSFFTQSWRPYPLCAVSKSLISDNLAV